MNPKYVKISEGGKVSMKDETKGSMYTEEEAKLGDALCTMVDADKELKHFFKMTCFRVLRDFAGDMDKAFRAQDKQKGEEVMRETIDLIKALAMHVYIKVTMKKKAVE